MMDFLNREFIRVSRLVLSKHHGAQGRRIGDVVSGGLVVKVMAGHAGADDSAGIAVTFDAGLFVGHADIRGQLGPRDVVVGFVLNAQFLVGETVARFTTHGEVGRVIKMGMDEPPVRNHRLGDNGIACRGSRDLVAINTTGEKRAIGMPSIGVPAQIDVPAIRIKDLLHQVGPRVRALTDRLHVFVDKGIDGRSLSHTQLFRGVGGVLIGQRQDEIPHHVGAIARFGMGNLKIGQGRIDLQGMTLLATFLEIDRLHISAVTVGHMAGLT